LAAEKGKETIVRTLLTRGADPNARWDCSCIYAGFTPLMVAVRGSKDKYNYPVNIVMALLDKGADINMRCRGDRDPPGFYGGSSALMLAVTKGSDEVAEILISRNADLSIKNDKGQSVLQVAAEDGSLNILHALIDKGLNVNERDNHGNTALMSTCDMKKVRLLLGKNCDVNIKNNDKETALMHATRCDNMDIAGALLDKGADINAKNKEGITALMMAAMHSRVEIVKSLLERGADAADKDTYGRTALDLAGKSVLTGEEKEKLTLLLKMAAEKKK